MKILEVEWDDSRGAHGWRTDVVKPPTKPCSSVGYVEKDDDEGVILYESIDLDPSTTHRYGCSTFIPRSAIRKTTQLRAYRKRGK